MKACVDFVIAKDKITMPRTKAKQILVKMNDSLHEEEEALI